MSFLARGFCDIAGCCHGIPQAVPVMLHSPSQTRMHHLSTKQLMLFTVPSQLHSLLARSFLCTARLNQSLREIYTGKAPLSSFERMPQRGIFTKRQHSFQYIFDDSHSKSVIQGPRTLREGHHTGNCGVQLEATLLYMLFSSY